MRPAAPNDAIVVSCSWPDAASARAAAAHLVEARLAACVQITPIDSVYAWQGAIETASETLTQIKTRRVHFAAITKSIRAMHPYDTPEILAVAVTAIDHAYANWLAEATTGA